LPPRCKSIFELVRNKGYSYKEAAKILNLTPKTVENQLRIATQKLHLDLDKDLKKINKKVS